MTIHVAHILHDEDFVPGLPPEDKFAALERLVDSLYVRHLVPMSGTRGVLDAVLRQEREHPSGEEGGVAAPWGRFEALHSSALVIGLAPDGVNFDAPDGSPSSVIVLLIEGGYEHQAPVRDALLDMLRADPALVEELARAENGFDARSVILAAETGAAG